MKPRYLVCCLFVLGASGCSQHFVKSTDTASLQQSSVTAVQSLYTTSGFDFSGQVKFAVQPLEKQGNVVTNAEFNQHLKNYMALQGITLNQTESTAFEKALQQERALATGGGWRQQGSEIAANFLQDLTVSYNGGIDFRDQAAALNLTARYDTEGLLVQAKYPIIVDLKETKIYSNFYALLPFLVSPEYRNQLSYIDFSQYRKQIEKVDLAKFVNFLKAMSSLPYRLANQDDLQQVSLTDADRKAGAVEKIRLITSAEEVSAKILAFTRVNQDYLSKTVFKFADDPQTDEAVSTQKDFKAMSEEQQADWATDQLRKMTTAKSEDDVADHSIAHAAEAPTAEAEEAETESTTRDDGLSYAQCQHYNGKSNIPLGVFAYCMDEYKTDVLNPATAENQKDLATSVSEFAQLSELFKPADKNELVSVDQFKTMWQQQEQEITKLLPPVDQRSLYVVDLLIDRQGRMVGTHTSWKIMKTKSMQHTIEMQAQMQYQHYGHPTAINRVAMKQAKALEDLSQNSVFKGLMAKLKKTENAEDFDAQVKKLAEQSFNQSHSYLKTYQLVYGLLFARDYPQAVKKYSTQDIQNLATIMAYRSLAKDGASRLTSQEKARLQQLEQKYQVGDSQLLQQETTEIVVGVQLNGEQQRQWQQVQQKYTSSTQRFEKWYELQYLSEYTNEKSNPHLKRVAERLGKFYEASRHQMISPLLFAGLSEEDYEYLDYDVFKRVYVKALEISKK